MPGYHWLPDPVQEWLLEREGERDAARLQERIPDLGEALARERGEVEDAYRAYLEGEEADPVMAASLPFSRFLLAWCRARRPGRIADLGSGFSSWVVRRWAQEAAGDVEVDSVDDDPVWLRRSEAFVRERGGPEGRFLSWRSFCREAAEGAEPYDLVVWDFGDVGTRARETPQAADRVAPGGTLLLDDVHKHRLWRAARRMRRRRGPEGYSLRAHTLDGYGRYAWLALFPGG